MLLISVVVPQNEFSLLCVYQQVNEFCVFFSDSNLISFEMAERPNYFLQLASNNTLVLSKWEEKEAFHNRSTFVIHKNTWLSGYNSFESFAKPGYFIHISASSVELLKYHHSEEFRLSTLFKLVGR